MHPWGHEPAILGVFVALGRVGSCVARSVLVARTEGVMEGVIDGIPIVCVLDAVEVAVFAAVIEGKTVVGGG